MNFSSHVKSIRERLKTCLSYKKHEMLIELQDCLIDAKSLLKTSSFDFYLSQFKVVDVAEFATTHYGVRMVKSSLNRKDLRPANSRINLESELLLASKHLLTYNVEDSCCMQTEFHWYYCIGGEFIYKESGMGVVEVPDGKEVFGGVRVAKVSELPTDFHTNLI